MHAQGWGLGLGECPLFRFHDGVAVIEANAQVGAIRHGLMMSVGDAH
jgi:hypothetical protein